MGYPGRRARSELEGEGEGLGAQSMERSQGVLMGGVVRNWVPPTYQSTDHKNLLKVEAGILGFSSL